MPVNNNAVKRETQKQSTSKPVPSTSSYRRKAAGTRYGTLEDWREGSSRSENGRHGHAIRDGR